MRVIGVGLGRTGTVSVRAALERLGFGPCYHGFDVFTDTDVARRWLRLDSGEPISWDEVFAGYHACLDMPPTAYWRELVDAYPQARILLTVRDPDQWYASMRRTIFPVSYADPSGASDAPQEILDALGPDQAAMGALLRRLMLGIMGAEEPSRERAIEVFERHVRDVQASVPADRLLTFDVAQGWEPLCGFLDVPVPDEEFPHLNDTSAFRASADSNFTEPGTDPEGGEPCE